MTLQSMQSLENEAHEKNNSKSPKHTNTEKQTSVFVVQMHLFCMDIYIVHMKMSITLYAGNT